MGTTQKKTYRNTFSGSVGAGMGSLFSPGGRKYYILEHKVTSKYHRAGESQEIIVDNIQIGRDSVCQVRFDENFKTVSRRHAAIVRDGDNWKLVQLSQTNRTFLNGHPVSSEWYLQNGDEIQLSVNGPKLGFIIPTGNKATVGSIGLTRRMSLFRQQALRPYKTAITILSVLLVLCVGGLTTWNIVEHNNWVEKERIAKAEMDEMQKEFEQEIDTRKKESAKTDSMLVAEREKYNKLRNQVHHLNKEVNKIKINPAPIDNSVLDACFKHVYFIRTEKIELIAPDGTTMPIENCGWSGTGFMLNDGRFVTARHVVEGWQFNFSDEKLLSMNMLIHSLGYKAKVQYGIYSSSGESYQVTNDMFVINRSSDQIVTDEDSGATFCVTPLDMNDWACVHTNKSGGLQSDPSLSNNLKRQSKLHILGYPQGYVTEKLTPIVGSGVVACDGLDRGVILTTETMYEQGNSGGPAIYINEKGEPVVVGLVSAGKGKTVGFIVPISNVR